MKLLGLWAKDQGLISRLGVLLRVEEITPLPWLVEVEIMCRWLLMGLEISTLICKIAV